MWKKDPSTFIAHPIRGHPIIQKYSSSSSSTCDSREKKKRIPPTMANHDITYTKIGVLQHR